jgi:Tfp pilus assembly protein PilN
MAYLGALAAACPRYSLGANLLPEALRKQSSKWIYAPSLALGAVLLAGMVGLGFYQRYEDSKYLEKLNAEVQFLEPRARQLQHIERRVAQARDKMRLLDQFQARTRTDLDAVKEVTRLVPPPAWLNMMELNRTTLTIGGEADQATGLLKALDSSAQFHNSEFVIPLSRVGNVESFRIRAGREGQP